MMEYFELKKKFRDENKDFDTVTVFDHFKSLQEQNRKLVEYSSHFDKCKIYEMYPLFGYGKSPEDAECTCGLDEQLKEGA